VGNEFKDLFGDWEPGEEPRPSGGSELAGEPENRVPHALNEKEVKVIGVYERPIPASSSGQTFVLLEDSHGRKVPIYIGRFEAFSISQAVAGEQLDRPLTYDLLSTLVERLGATVERAIIDDIWQSTFYAKLTVVRDGASFDIDCRPSDAVNIALRAHAPIYVAEAVIESSQEEF
jgi:hypothetical protein